MDNGLNPNSDSSPNTDDYEIVGRGEPEIESTKNEKKRKNVTDIETETMKSNNDLKKNSFECCDRKASTCNPENSPLEYILPDKISSLYTTSPSPLYEHPLSRSFSFPIEDGEYTIFDRVTYLGCAAIADSHSEEEIFKNMAILHEQSFGQAIEISLSLPSHSEGSVILYEPSSINEIARFPIQKIPYFTQGKQNGQEDQCFTFTCRQGSDVETAIIQCHVFKCDVPEAVPKIIQCFDAAFRRAPKIFASRVDSDVSEKLEAETSVKVYEQTYAFEATLEFKEEDSKGNCSSCPRDKDYFKFRCKLEKSVNIVLQQVSSNKELSIERCFGLLISPGRNLRSSDMQLIEMVSFNKISTAEKSYQIVGHWDPNESPFAVLNKETARDTRVYMTIAVDIVFGGIQEPVRFIIETKAKILPQNERFWYITRKTLQEQFYLRLRETKHDNNIEHIYDIISVESATRLERKKALLSLQLTHINRSASVLSASSPGEPESDSNDDEPLLSGTGDVSKDCTQTELEGWADVLAKWRQNLKQRPRLLKTLVHKGIPEALRGEVWQLLAGSHDDKEILNEYRLLLNKDCSYENVIQRDINRTFPAHEYFRDSGGSGQDSLYKICKAYCIYDQEVGYCQGLSFLVAALLLHMPEEQAFGVLVKIMFEYGLRDLFRNGFEELHLKFYQLQKLIEEQMPELYCHFADLGIEVHMFGSQWFLTLFTAKFPLCVVFYILDFFLLDGMDTIFQVSLALLMMSKKELLALDFEGILKHFRVSLPKKYRSEETALQLMNNAFSVKIKKLKKYKKEYLSLKDQEKQQEDPIERLLRENKRLLESNMRLEQENADLANELVTKKVQLQSDLDTAEDKADTFNKELLATKTSLVEVEEEKKRLETEVEQLKEVCRRELLQAEQDNVRNTSIIADYKQICGQLSARLEKEQSASRKVLESLKIELDGCDSCSKLVDNNTLGILGIKDKKGAVADNESSLQDAEKQIRELELELAQTKLALVEAECRNQDLTHQLNSAMNDLQESKNTWFHKTLSSIRDVTRKEYGSAREGKDKEAS